MLAHRSSKSFSNRPELVERGGALQPASPSVHSVYRGIGLGTDHQHALDQKQHYVSRRQVWRWRVKWLESGCCSSGYLNMNTECTETNNGILGNDCIKFPSTNNVSENKLCSPCPVQP